MAFNRAPSQSTYQTRDIKLLFQPDNRDQAGTKDIITLNGFFDLIRDKIAEQTVNRFVKRDGTVQYPYTVPSSNLRGLHHWEDENKLYIAYDNKIDVVVASTGVLVTTLTPFTSTSGDVGFTEFYYDTGDVKLVATDGDDLVTIDNTETVVPTADPDFPSPIDPHPVFLDGYLFVVATGTSDIYNSDLNDPLAWSPGDFITAEMLPDTLIRIARLNNYLVAFGSASIEYFYDAGNASGSPLSRNDTPIKADVGYLGGFAFHQNKIYFVGQSASTDPDVYILEDFKMSLVNAPALRRYIEPFTTFQGSIISMGGHDFYVINVGTITYMMDLESRLWSRLSFQNQGTFPVEWATTVPISGVGNTSVMILDNTDKLYYFDPDVYTDAGVEFTTQITTEGMTFDTFREKYMSRFMVIGDRPPSPALAYLSWSDDDYKTFSTPRPIQMDSEFPVVQRLGRFRKRAFRLSFTANAPFRVATCEVDFNIGGR